MTSRVSHCATCRRSVVWSLRESFLSVSPRDWGHPYCVKGVALVLDHNPPSSMQSLMRTALIRSHTHALRIFCPQDILIHIPHSRPYPYLSTVPSMLFNNNPHSASYIYLSTFVLKAVCARTCLFICFLGWLNSA